jgi:sarcosine oxidase
MGSSAAWWLARRGRAVVLVEQFAAGHDRGSSHGGVRIFRLGYPDPLYVRLALDAVPLWRELEADAGRPLLEVTGAVDHGDPAAIAALADAFTAAGAAHEHVSRAAAAERWPHLRTEGDVLFHPDGGRCLAAATVASLQERAIAHGAEARFDAGRATVEADRAGDGVVVRAGDEEWRAPVAVLTAGAWLPRLLPATIAAPALTVTREHIQHFRPRAGFGDPATWPSVIHRRPPWAYGLHDPALGTKVALHQVGPVVDPDSPAEPDPERAAEVGRYVGAWFPGLDPEPLHLERCLYTTTPTEDFVLDRVGPFVIGSPCSGHGFKFTPIVGRLLADLADGEPPAFPELTLRGRGRARA